MKKLSTLQAGTRFMYGGVEWVKFEDIGAGTLCLAAEPAFLRKFDDGMTDYGTAVDKIALRSDALCRKYREITPPVDAWCWNLTPWTCDHEYSCNVRNVNSSGALNDDNAYYGASTACARFAI